MQLGARFNLTRPPPVLHHAHWEQFSFLSTLEDDALCRLHARMTVKTFAKGQLIIRKGDIGTRCASTVLPPAVLVLKNLFHTDCITHDDSPHDSPPFFFLRTLCACAHAAHRASF